MKEYFKSIDVDLREARQLFNLIDLDGTGMNKGLQDPSDPPPNLGQSSRNSNGSFQHTIIATGLIFCAKRAMILSFILAKFGPDPWEIKVV